MSDDNTETNQSSKQFDFSIYPSNTLFYERRSGRERRKSELDADETQAPAAADHQKVAHRERRARKERRRRIDPTTFEKQYTEDELEFMNAMQHFKEQTGKSFPTHGEVLKVAASLGYRKLVIELLDDGELDEDSDFRVY